MIENHRMDMFCCFGHYFIGTDSEMNQPSFLTFYCFLLIKQVSDMIKTQVYWQAIVNYGYFGLQIMDKAFH